MRLSNLNPRTWKRPQPKPALDEIAEVVPDSISLKLAPHLLLGARGERLAGRLFHPILACGEGDRWGREGGLGDLDVGRVAGLRGCPFLRALELAFCQCDLRLRQFQGRRRGVAACVVPSKRKSPPASQLVPTG